MDYTITVDLSTLPDGFQPTLIRVGTDSALDSDDPAGTLVNLPNTGFDYVNSSIDYGFTSPVVCRAAIGDLVFNDLNNNGIQDAGEGGISGAAVTLGGAATGSLTTGANGAYAFNNLCAGTYTVCVGAPMGFQGSPANQGDNDATDSDGLVTGMNSCATVTVGATETDHGPLLDGPAGR